MELSGKLINKLTPITGTSSKGNWKRQDCIIETAEQYPKKVCVTFWENADKIQAVPDGTKITCHINIESREYNSRWFTDVRCWKFTTEASQTPVQETPVQEPENLKPSNDSIDDLPF